MLAGVIVNVLLAMLIYGMMAFSWGSTYLPTSNLKYGIAVDSIGYSLGLRNGDHIKYVNGDTCSDYSKVVINLLLNEPKTLTVTRNGKDTTITFGDDKIALMLSAQEPFMNPRFPFVIAGFPADIESPGKAAGFMVGDSIILADGKSCAFYQDVTDFMLTNIGKEATFTVMRGSDSVNLSLLIPDDGKLMVMTKGPMDYLETATQEYGFFESFPVGISRGIDKTVEYCKQWKLIFNPDTEAYKSVGSFITMTKIFPGTWDWYSFWSLTALFSIMLAVVNVIPIPGLDGGHALFTLVEIITGKAPSEKFLERAQMVGMIILLLIMALAIGNDFIRHVFN